MVMWYRHVTQGAAGPTTYITQVMLKRTRMALVGNGELTVPHGVEQLDRIHSCDSKLDIRGFLRQRNRRISCYGRLLPRSYFNLLRALINAFDMKLDLTFKV